MPWPDVTEFTHYLQAAGLYGTTPTAIQLLLDLQGSLDTAVDIWNDETRYWPFLSNGDVNEPRKFQPTISSLLDLNGGLLTLTSLATEVLYTNNASNGGVARTASLDFFLRPADAPQRKKPWTYLEAGRWRGGGLTSGWPDSIVITGEWGFCKDANLPAAARSGVLALAAQDLMPQITMALRNGGLSMLQEGDSTKRWDTKLAEMSGFWDSVASKALAQYRRARIA